MRLAILDVNNDGRFKKGDLAVYRAAYFGVPETATPDYGRYDLNGDGFTGGLRRETLRPRSHRLHPVWRGHVHPCWPGGYSESSLTDAEILCFYADSLMYEGTIDSRNQLLQDLCPLTVAVTPQSATVSAGDHEQFAATVTGTSDPRVTWSATGGSITAAGEFTAGTVAGTFSVRATSVVNPNAFGEATLTILTASPVTQVSGPSTATRKGASPTRPVCAWPGGGCSRLDPASASFVKLASASISASKPASIHISAHRHST